MRILEIIQIDREPVATERFRKEFEELRATNPKSAKDLEDFIEFKRTAPFNSHYGKKDFMFSNGDLAGFWHWHLIFGKLIVLYQMTSDQLQLISMVSHKAIDGAPPKAFGHWLRGLNDASFTPFEIPKEPTTAKISDAERTEVESLFWDLASNPTDREYLTAAVKGDWSSDLMDFMLDLVKGPITGEQKWIAIQDAFGGLQALTDQIKMILKSTNQS